nr:hypothetical protein [Tanacetum cinerariifolium]
MQTDDELTEKELKQIKADDQAIQTILLGLPEDIYAAVDSCETAQEIWQNVGKLNGYNDVQKVGNQNPNGNGNLVAARAEGNATGHNGNHIRCYNCRGVGHFARNCMVRPRRRDAAYLQTQLLIAQKEEVGIQLQAEEFDLMAAAADLDEIKEVNANCILMANLQIKELDNILVKTGQLIQTIHMLSPKPDSFYHTEQKMALGYQNPFYLKQAQQKQQSLYDGKVLLEKHDPPVVHDSEETLQLAQESRQNMKQLNKEIKPVNYTKINHLSGVFVSQTAKSRKELYFSNTFKTATVSKPISIPNEEFLDDTTPSVARKFLNEVKSTIVTLQHVVKHRMTLDTHNWSSSAHQELHKIVKDENFPIVNQVDARVQNFEIQFLKEAVKFVGDFKSLAKEADESLAKHKALELRIECFLRAVSSQDIMSVVQNNYVGETSNLQSELEHTKERFENCIIKKENEYAKLWNYWYKKCEECKFDKISYDKAYNDMQQKTKRLQAQLGDLKGKSKDTSCVSDTLNPLSQKLENENVELEFQQSIVGNLPKVGEIHDLSKPVTSNLIPTPQESKVVKNDKVIAPGIFRINPFKTSREEKHVPNKDRASVRSKPITVSQPPVITKKDVNSDSNGLSSTGIDNTKTRRPQPRSNTKNDRVPSASKSSCNKNKGVEIEEHHRNLLLSKNKKHMSSVCNNVKFDSQNVKSKVVCAMCKKCLISINHDVCLLNYVNGKTSRGKTQKPNVSINEKQKKQQPQVKKTKKVGFIERLATPKPSKPRSFLRSKDEASEVIKTFLKRITILLQSPVIIIRTDNGTEFKNQVLKEYFDKAARIMLIFSRAPLFLWAKAIATACFNQNRSIIHRQFNKTPYKLINGRKPDILFFHVFGALFYPKNDREDTGKLGAKGDIGLFICYSADSCAFRVYNRRTNKIMETMNVSFDELSAMDFEQRISKPGLQSMTFGQISSGLDLTYAPSTITTQQPTEGELDLLFEAMYDDYIGGHPSATSRSVLTNQAHQVCQTSTTSTSIADTAPTPTNSSSQAINFPNSSHDVDGLRTQQPHAQQQGNQASLHSETVVDNQAPKSWYDELTMFLLQNHFFKGTIDPTLFIRRFDDDILVDSGFKLTGFSDADYAGCKDTFKSTSGGAQFLGEKLVSWSLKKQDCTALSTTEAEYVSLSAC